MPFVACKLPAGLTIQPLSGEPINLRGPNDSGSSVLAPNGITFDTEDRAAGYGLTQLTDDQAARFVAWSDSVTTKDGKPVAQPFLPLDNGSILGPFKSKDEARKEAQAVHAMVSTGFEGIDPATDQEMKAAGVETADKDAKRGK